MSVIVTLIIFSTLYAFLIVNNKNLMIILSALYQMWKI